MVVHFGGKKRDFRDGRREWAGSGWLPPSQGWGGLRDEDAPGTGDTQGSGPSDARVVFVTARCRDDGASVRVLSGVL